MSDFFDLPDGPDQVKDKPAGSDVPVLFVFQGQKHFISRLEAIQIINQLSGILEVNERSK